MGRALSSLTTNHWLEIVMGRDTRTYRRNVLVLVLALALAHVVASVMGNGISRLSKDALKEAEPKHRLRQQNRQYERYSACSDGEHCQQIVAEDQLEACLARGFRVQLVLPSGKVVVESAG